MLKCYGEVLRKRAYFRVLKLRIKRVVRVVVKVDI